ncbi:unnamed protein product [Nyctereutes procyonoides]|uniref:(raccoon dog) hypothetical protein n=1 Tax=Nyctereutes procyonoides TaxID=34880 RepID=A0A811YIQ3_NYCPR|nr:unnamed protein product [Nyctereutes procyonoides]
MGEFMKAGKAVLVLAGCHSGCKLFIVKNIGEGTPDCPYSHTLVSGIDRYAPHKVTAAMGKKEIAKRSKIKSLVKVHNYNRLMPMKYSVNSPLDKTDLKQDAKAKFKERHKTGKNKLLPEAAVLYMYICFVAVI